MSCKDAFSCNNFQNMMEDTSKVAQGIFLAQHTLHCDVIRFYIKCQIWSVLNLSQEKHLAAFRKIQTPSLFHSISSQIIPYVISMDSNHFAKYQQQGILCTLLCRYIRKEAYLLNIRKNLKILTKAFYSLIAFDKSAHCVHKVGMPHTTSDYVPICIQVLLAY